MTWRRHPLVTLALCTAAALVSVTGVTAGISFERAEEPTPFVSVVDVQLRAPLHQLNAGEREEVVLDLARRTMERTWRLADAVEAAAGGPPPRLARAGHWGCAAAREVVVCWRERQP